MRVLVSRRNRWDQCRSAAFNMRPRGADELHPPGCWRRKIPPHGAPISALEALRADARVAVHSRELVSLDPFGATPATVAALLDGWRSYTDLRERVISLALEGRLAEARDLEAGPCGSAFERATASLQAIQQSLADFSAYQQETVRTGLREAVAELGALATTTILFVATLIWSRRKQRKLLSLQRRAEQLERERGRILEMAGRNEPLLAILQVLVSVTQKQLPGSVVCVSVIQDGRLRDVVAPGLPKPVPPSPHIRAEPSRAQDGSGYPRQNEALAHGLEDLLVSGGVMSPAQGIVIGCVECLPPARTSTPQRARSPKPRYFEGVAKLAGIVIQHREIV